MSREHYPRSHRTLPAPQRAFLRCVTPRSDPCTTLHRAIIRCAELLPQHFLATYSPCSLHVRCLRHVVATPASIMPINIRPGRGGARGKAGKSQTEDDDAESKIVSSRKPPCQDRTVPAPSPQVKEDPPAAREPTPKQPSKDTHPKRQAQSKPRKDCRSPAVRTRASGREHPVPSGSSIGDVAPVAQAAVVENPSPSSEALVKTGVTLRSAVTSHDGVTDGPSKGRAVPPAAQSPTNTPGVKSAPASDDATKQRIVPRRTPRSGLSALSKTAKPVSPKVPSTSEQTVKQTTRMRASHSKTVNKADSPGTHEEVAPPSRRQDSAPSENLRSSGSAPRRGGKGGIAQYFAAQSTTGRASRSKKKKQRRRGTPQPSCPVMESNRRQHLQKPHHHSRLHPSMTA